MKLPVELQGNGKDIFRLNWILYHHLLSFSEWIET